MSAFATLFLPFVLSMLPQDPPAPASAPAVTPLEGKKADGDKTSDAAKHDGEKKPGAEKAPPDPKLARDVSQYNLGEDGLAIAGYDPVAYFPEGGGTPTEGDEKITYDFRGVHYRFATTEHRDLFVKDPTKFEPAYGGWCAYGMAKDDKVEIDPESFLIIDGHLMLYYDGLFADTRAKWQDEGTATLKPKADKAWDGFLAKKK